MKKQKDFKIPNDLRNRLETARLEALALFRALDCLDLTPDEIPQDLMRELFELDADFAEALWALDQPPYSLDYRAMVRDTLESLKWWPDTCQEFLEELPSRSLAPLDKHRRSIHPKLTIQDAYTDIPGRDPNMGDPLFG